MEVILKVNLNLNPISRNTRLQLHSGEWAQIWKYQELSKILWFWETLAKSVVPKNFICISDHFFQKNFSRQNCMVGHAQWYFLRKQQFWATWETITAIKVTNGNNIVLQLKSIDKNLFNGMFKLKIEHSYENLVISKVAKNCILGAPTCI